MSSSFDWSQFPSSHFKALLNGLKKNLFFDESINLKSEIFDNLNDLGDINTCIEQISFILKYALKHNVTHIDIKNEEYNLNDFLTTDQINILQKFWSTNRISIYNKIIKKISI